MDEINPNTDVDGAGETKSVAPGEVLSFEDIEDLPLEKAEAKEEKEEESDEPEKSDDGATNEDSTDEGEEEPEGEKEEPEGSAEDAPDDTKAEFRAVKGEYDGEEVELAGDTVFPTKVAGKTEKPTLTELQQNYSGKVNWDRKNNEVHQREKAARDLANKAESQLSEVQTRVSDLLKKSEEDPHAFLDVVAELHQTDPVQLKMKTIKAQIKNLEPLLKMSESEREAYFDKLEVKFEKERIAAQKRISEVEHSRKELDTKASEAREQYAISDEDYQDCLSKAREYMRGQDRKPEPQDVVTVHRHLMALDALQSAAADWVESLDLDTEAGQRTFDQSVTKIRNLAIENPDWTQQDLEEVIEGAFSSRSAENLSRKVSKTRSGKAQSVPPKKAGKKNVLTSFDQLD